MAAAIDRTKLEKYAAGELTPAMKRRVEDALEASADLRQLLEQVTDEAEIVEAVRDSQAIRLPEGEEERIVTELVGSLRTAMDTPDARGVCS